MKIVKAPETWQSRKVSCACGAVLEIEFSDLRREHYEGDQREPSFDKVYVVCPLSSHSISIADVPEWLVGRIPTK